MRSRDEDNLQVPIHHPLVGDHPWGNPKRLANIRRESNLPTLIDLSYRTQFTVLSDQPMSMVHKRRIAA